MGSEMCIRDSSTTAAHSIDPALSSGAACVRQSAARVSPLDARRASISISLSPVFLCQRARLMSNRFYLDYGGLRMDRSLEVDSVYKVCWTTWNMVRVHLGLANICLHLESTPQLPRGRDRKRSDIYFSGHSAGERQDAVALHSTTAAHRTAPALSSGAVCVSQAASCVSPAAARVSPLDARRASLSLSQLRVAVPESETAEQYVFSGLRGPQNGQEFGGSLGAQDLPDALEHGSSEPRSGEHLPPPREHAGELPRGRDGRRWETTFFWA